MGIYINGMEMPKEGTVFVIDSTGQVWSNEWPTKGYIRLNGVTAIPVPPHGDLIDRDALGIRDIEKQEYEIYLREKGEDFVDDLLLEYLRGSSDGMTHASGLVRFAPTIIPADRKE